MIDKDFENMKLNTNENTKQSERHGLFNLMQNDHIFATEIQYVQSSALNPGAQNKKPATSTPPPELFTEQYKRQAVGRDADS